MDAKLELMQSTEDTNMKMPKEKITEVKSLTKVKQDTITDDFILEAADTMKYKTSDTVVPKLVRELAVKYVERPEKLYGAFGEICNHPLGEIPTSEGLARACTHWLKLWVKNQTPMDLVYKLRDLEKSVIHDETEKLREKLQKRENRWSSTSSHDTAEDTDSDCGLIQNEFLNNKSNSSVFYQHIVNC